MMNNTSGTDPHTEDTFLSLSALQHYLFCPRQTALIHLEQVWAENSYTAEGNVIHKRAHEGDDETRSHVRITRSLPVHSYTLGVSGQCDIVEFHKDGRVIPVEYKRGKPKAHQADEVQLCAQAMCLEEMLEVTIPTGHLFYGQRKRRTEVPLTEELRAVTRGTAEKLHHMIQTRSTPHATYEARKCLSCSLFTLCQPKSLRLKRGAASWFQSQLNNHL